MKMTITGIEINEGTSKRTNKAYSMGAIHTTTQLAPPFGEGNVAKGFAGDKFECDPVLLRPIAHLPFPIEAEVEVQSQIRFGERQQVVVDVKPISTVRKAA